MSGRGKAWRGWAGRGKEHGAAADSLPPPNKNVNEVRAESVSNNNARNKDYEKILLQDMRHGAIGT